jgi:hypothetical protein
MIKTAAIAAALSALILSPVPASADNSEKRAEIKAKRDEIRAIKDEIKADRAEIKAKKAEIKASKDQIKTVPGPIAGAGLPALALAGGYLWLRRRRQSQRV